MTTPTVDMVLLNRAKTGNEMLTILDTLTRNNAKRKQVDAVYYASTGTQPTLSSIDF
jgi:hypothetical protein